MADKKVAKLKPKPKLKPRPKLKRKRKRIGFTIAELIIAIVVTGILLVITIISFTGVRSRSIVASLVSDLDGVSRQLKLNQVDNNVYPISINDCPTPASGSVCFKASDGTTYQYAASNDTTPQTFCVTATKETISYNITQDGVPSIGICPILNLDASNSSSYSGSGDTWTDLSGEGNNGTLVNDVDYIDDGGGALSFDGSNGYVSVMGLTAHSVGMWVKPSSAQLIAYPTYYNQGDQTSSSGYWWVYTVGASSSLNWQYTDGATPKTISWDNAINYDTWNYLVFVFNEPNETITLYKNGTSLGTKNCPNAILPSSTFYIGDYQGRSHGYGLKGLVNGFRVYNKILSADDISKTFKAHKKHYEM